MSNKISWFFIWAILTSFLFVVLIALLAIRMEKNIEDIHACDASSTMIFWNTGSPDAEKELKKHLTEMSIDYADLLSQTWDPETGNIGGMRDIALSFIDTNSLPWVALALPLHTTLAYTISVELSKHSNSPVITFLEFDQSAWGYCLFEKGKLLDTFWNNHWAIDKDSSECIADIDLVASKFNVPKESIAPYLQSVFDKYDLGKAFDDDEFELTNHWVRTDFMEKIGLQYPDVKKVKWFNIVE